MSAAAPQRVYAALQDLADDVISEEQLLETCRQAGRDMDAQQCEVVASLITSK
jgi:hypothetical protein